ncbi:alpha/beta hydrolase [Oenococcus sp. UCMA 16435]|nr:alpha/beta hydrolase [Oenococcus sp. UCMA 16435]MDI4583878.1 alpha/beta fold hydrolase [Oenococcus sp. UCMA 14587]
MAISQSKFSYGKSQSQFGIFRMPKNAANCPVVVTIHGGFWRAEYGLEEMTPLDEDLVRRGYATWNIEYRRVGEKGGGWPGTFNDIIDAVNYLVFLKEDFPIDLSRVVIAGHSAGGHLALWLASRIVKNKADELGNVLRTPIKVVVSLAGVANLEEMWKIGAKLGTNGTISSFIGGTPKEVPERYHLASPYDLLPLNVKQILAHGEIDREVPIELTIDYYQKALELGDDVSLISYPEADHLNLIDPFSSIWISTANSLKNIINS